MTRHANGCAQNPDVAVVIYNDDGLNFFLDKLPAIAIGAAPEYRNADEGWGIPTIPPFEAIPSYCGTSSIRFQPRTST